MAEKVIIRVRPHSVAEETFQKRFLAIRDWPLAELKAHINAILNRAGFSDFVEGNDVNPGEMANRHAACVFRLVAA